MSIDKDAFLDAKNGLLLVRTLSRLEDDRTVNKSLDALLENEERKNGYTSRVPLLNQSAYLAFAYLTLVWLRESYFKDQKFIELINKRVSPIFNDETIKPVDLVRHVRNSLAHADMEIKEQTFVFKDSKQGKDAIEMSWPKLARLCESIIFAGNDLLYPEWQSEDHM